MSDDNISKRTSHRKIVDIELASVASDALQFHHRLTTPSSRDHDDADSIDSNFEPDTKTLTNLSKDEQRIRQRKLQQSPSRSSSIRVTLESEQYDADTIRKEFERYRRILPPPEELLQHQHSFFLLRKTMEENNIELPRYLKYNYEGGIKPHHALCCLLLAEWEQAEKADTCKTVSFFSLSGFIQSVTFGKLHKQLNHPAEFIRDQFNRVAHVVPLDVVTPEVLRKKIKNRGLPVPNYFLDPENDKQFPPHIALLVILQNGLQESRKLDNVFIHVAFSLFAIVALLLRIVLEVIGGAGAIWGGAEVFGLRYGHNAELWRWISVGVGIVALMRFYIMNLPQREDEGDILGPAGPWSLRLPVRMRTIADHPFHYFVRALPPSRNRTVKNE